MFEEVEGVLLYRHRPEKAFFIKKKKKKEEEEEEEANTMALFKCSVAI